jgi:RsiW-degrading membrane proteinase PrsW (M82 family)
MLIGLALAPVVAIIVFVWFKDRYDKEPVKLLLLGFLLGAFSIIPAIILELIGNNFFPRMTLLNIFLYAFFVVALSEEGVKYFILRTFFYRKSAFNEPFDGIVYAVMISMGFAAAENVMYVLNNGLLTAVMRMFTAVPAHAGFAVMMGFFVGLAKFSKRFKFYYKFLGLFVAIVFHGLYDFFLLQNDFGSLKYLAFVVLLICVSLSLRALNKKRKYLLIDINPEEVPEGDKEVKSQE